MELTPDNYSRIAKFFVDRDGAEYCKMQKQLSNYKVALVCGPEIFEAPTLQAAVLTAANVASRCFQNGISFHPPEKNQDRCVMPWHNADSLSSVLKTVVPRINLGSSTVPSDVDIKIIFGSRPDCNNGIQVTYDGWVAAVGPKLEMSRLPEREMCIVAGVAGGSLAVSEIFLNFAKINIEATRRTVGLSLWQPDLDWKSSEAIGVPVEYLPTEFWLLGLGHLGQAYVWTLSMLPFKSPENVNIILQDFDTIISANMDTGLLTKHSDIGIRKTRVSDNWLRSLGFSPLLIERAFDEGVKRKEGEPSVALCGFDGQGPRHLLDRANFNFVIECGLGGRADNFDAISFHTLPDPANEASKIWPPSQFPLDIDKKVVKLASNNQVYQSYHNKNKCGHIELAGKSVAVPFVGAIASSLAISELLRIMHEGNRYRNIELSLEDISTLRAVRLEPDLSNNLSIRYQTINS